MALTDRLELYVSALCPYAQRVRIALAEKELRAVEIEVDPRKKPSYLLALSPDGKIPVLVHRGQTFWESGVINEYLEDAFPDRRLMPEAPQDRAQVRAMVSFADQHIYAPTHDLLLSMDPEMQLKLGEAIALRLRWLEDHSLARHDGPYLGGTEFGLADIALIPWFEQVAVLEAFRGFRMPEDCPRLTRWFEVARCRDGVASVLRDPEHYLSGYGALAKLQAEGRLRTATAQ